MVQEVVVAHKDRLCRYGAELLEFIFKRFGTKLVVHSHTAGGYHENPTREPADDLLAVTTVFVARHNGRRSAENRRKRKARDQEDGNGHKTDGTKKTKRRQCDNASTQDQNIPNKTTKENTLPLVRVDTLDVQSLRRSDQWQNVSGDEERTESVHHKRACVGRNRL